MKFYYPSAAAAAAAAKSLQSCPTLCDTIDDSPPGSSAHGTLQARVLEWVAIAFSTILLDPAKSNLFCETSKSIFQSKYTFLYLNLLPLWCNSALKWCSLKLFVLNSIISILTEFGNCLTRVQMFALLYTRMYSLQKCIHIYEHS